ncbi:bactofilin family protein [Mucilaginibacter boryungensis]|uniref:Polymer-forming cytoskeletal protein n=1 Tax=Mucilaginibacter boryungensis TaxID=768480 RepID=A0ABR9XMW3_9SPHI|nr:polymer-forming cytoskeletal protein [Mucilaginibacter boryungensis]MBE9668626.1 polymer-forming cytoskeletal protein [Mucilaginibacter boryungensis]
MALFKKNGSVELDQQTISSIVSEGCVIEGNLNAPAFVRIDGQINGNVTIEQGLILGEKGNIQGNVQTKQMVVYGHIDGDITTDVLEIRSTGKITGKITTARIQVDAGAVYNGSLSMA